MERGVSRCPHRDFAVSASVAFSLAPPPEPILARSIECFATVRRLEEGAPSPDGFTSVGEQSRLLQMLRRRAPWEAPECLVVVRPWADHGLVSVRLHGSRGWATFRTKPLDAPTNGVLS